MTELFSLGDLYVSDFLRPDESPRAAPVELKLIFDDDTGIVHLDQAADPELMWGQYWYRSGTNATMTRELAEIVQSIERVTQLDPGDVWLDIASNDGTLLSHVRKDLFRVGIDPADDTFREEAEQHADIIVQAPFSVAQARSAGILDAKVITCIAMFYDLEDPTQFLAGVYDTLDRDGVFVLQMSYTPLMLHQLAFDNICHEHVRYYTLKTIRDVLDDAGFQLMDCQLNDVNGGSFRVYAMRNDADVTKFGSQPYRDVCHFRLSGIIAYENDSKVNTPEAWQYFHLRLERLKSEVVTFIRRERSLGKTVWGYGASTKGNTLLQYFGLDHMLIDGIAERSPYKFGLRTVGTNIPIYSEEQMRAAKPDYLLMLPWHFINEFTAREADYLAAGGKFIVPCPLFEIISA